MRWNRWTQCGNEGQIWSDHNRSEKKITDLTGGQCCILGQWQEATAGFSYFNPIWAKCPGSHSSLVVSVLELGVEIQPLQNLLYQHVSQPQYPRKTVFTVDLDSILFCYWHFTIPEESFLWLNKPYFNRKVLKVFKNRIKDVTVFKNTKLKP